MESWVDVGTRERVAETRLQIYQNYVEEWASTLTVKAKGKAAFSTKWSRNTNILNMTGNLIVPDPRFKYSVFMQAKKDWHKY